VTHPFYHALASDAAERYRPAGRFAYHFAYGKLTRDPAFALILEHGLLARGGRILDLGCGQGLIAALIEAARARREVWPADWPLPPDASAYLGIDAHPRDIDRAGRSVDGLARFAFAAFEGEGMLLLRVADESPALCYRFSTAVDWIAVALRRHRFERLHGRPLAEWIRALEALDFEVTATPMRSGLPFPNVLLVAMCGCPRKG